MFLFLLLLVVINLRLVRLVMKMSMFGVRDVLGEDSVAYRGLKVSVRVVTVVIWLLRALYILVVVVGFVVFLFTFLGVLLASAPLILFLKTVEGPGLLTDVATGIIR